MEQWNLASSRRLRIYDRLISSTTQGYSRIRRSVQAGVRSGREVEAEYLEDSTGLTDFGSFVVHIGSSVL